ncbi:uncharacterized protein LOC117125284 [Anneissia japonica]|uniref:uncharacterized protein LOC117125284 n=1 Tax=Anneissia japonica TaxID=1529436 RepID=UPI0014259F26|nr:uncharacterized protein LOC117125284 [Anneissia japonica]
MALDSLLGVYPHLTEQYKYQVLLSHLGGNIRKLAEAFIHETKPYSAALSALQEKYGQPRQLVQSEIGQLLQTPPIRSNDTDSFGNFALSVHSLVGMLRSIEGDSGYELQCGSYVDRLISKLAPPIRDRFVEHCINRKVIETNTDKTYNLKDLSDWLQTRTRAQRIANQASTLYKEHYPVTKKPSRTTSFMTTERKCTFSKMFCPYCTSNNHYLGGCREFKELKVEQVVRWIKEKKRCWRCGRTHLPENCTLKRPCRQCNDLHLTVLHDATTNGGNKPPSTVQLYIDRQHRLHNVMLKILPVTLHGPKSYIDTYAILDDGSMRIIIMTQALKKLHITGVKDSILLTTVNQGRTECSGYSVNLHVSSRDNHQCRFSLQGVFSAHQLSFSEYTHPIQSLQKRYAHLRQIPLTDINQAKPLILIGSDNAGLILPLEPVRLGPRGAPAAIRTALGWTIQGPSHLLTYQQPQSTYFVNTKVNQDLLKNVKRLWEIDILPYSKHAVRSRQDNQAVELLERRRFELKSMGRSERQLQTNPEKAETHNQLVRKLVDDGCVKEISREEAVQSNESWYFPHHVVSHNGKDRLVFNCSYEHNGKVLNANLLPGPTLGASLLGVILRFRQHRVAVSGDIKAMFHQIRLLPEDRPLLRFVWRDLQRNIEPCIYEWQVLPFGTTCSPCCATFALQKHVNNYRKGYENVVHSVEHAFYVDNCLDSLPTVTEAKELVMNMRTLLAC